MASIIIYIIESNYAEMDFEPLIILEFTTF